jgi:hypothetical protein
MSKDLQDIKQFLQSNNFKPGYPNCNGNMDLSEKALFDEKRFTTKAKKYVME